MPSAKRHKAAVQYNLRSAEACLAEFADWAAVMLFYAGVHAVEQLFAEDGVHHRTHEDRESRIKRQCQEIWPHYRVLKQESLKARYLADGGFSKTPSQVRTDLREKRLASILRFVETQTKAIARSKGRSD